MITKNGHAISDSQFLSEMGNIVERLGQKVFKDVMIPAAEEAQSAMKVVIAESDEHGPGKKGGVLDHFAQFSGGDGRYLTGNLYDSIGVEIQGKSATDITVLAGTRNAPEYFFAQDEGWDSHDAPDGAHFAEVPGMEARRYGFKAAVSVVEDEIGKL